MLWFTPKNATVDFLVLANRRRGNFSAGGFGGWRFMAAIFLAIASLSKPAVSQEPKANQIALKCDVGPVNKEYGKTQWLVYSCNDQRSVVFVSAPGNPAMPFYFMLSPSNSGYQLRGEGTGRKEATAAAFGAIQALSDKDIAILIAETKKR